jgi:predicted ABC-type ATPase
VSQPTAIFVAGPNGAGKSTLTSGNLGFFSSFPLLDPDVLANPIQADSKNRHPLAAGREVLDQIEENLRNRCSFAVETTLSGKIYLQTMLDARGRGYKVSLIYVGTADVEINLQRVADRVALGGHGVPETDIRRRYNRSLNNLLVAVTRTDLTVLFDNSRPISEGLRGHSYDLVAVIEDGIAYWIDPTPTWAAPLRASFRRS